MCGMQEAVFRRKFRAWNASIRKEDRSQINDPRFKLKGFPGGAVVKNPPANAGDTG